MLAVADVIIAANAVLIPLLVVGPLIAAVRGGPRATTAVAALSLVLAIALGPIDEGLFAAQHIVQCVVVLAGGFFAVAAAGARERYERAERATQAALAGERAARIEANIVARASELLATTLEPEERLAQVVGLAVPEMADVATVDLLEPDGTLRRRGRRTPPSPGSPRPSSTPAGAGRSTRRASIRSRSPPAPARRSSCPTMSPEHLDEASLSPGHLEHMKRLRYASGIAVPLIARGRTLGVFAFVRRAGRARLRRGGGPAGRRARPPRRSRARQRAPVRRAARRPRTSSRPSSAASPRP